METSRLTRDGTAELVSRDQILRHARGQGNIYFPCSADHEQDWQPYPVDPYSAICDDRTYIHTYILNQYNNFFKYLFIGTDFWGNSLFCSPFDLSIIDAEFMSASTKIMP